MFDDANQASPVPAPTGRKYYRKKHKEIHVALKGRKYFEQAYGRSWFINDTPFSQKFVTIQSPLRGSRNVRTGHRTII